MEENLTGTELLGRLAGLGIEVDVGGELFFPTDPKGRLAAYNRVIEHSPTLPATLSTLKHVAFREDKSNSANTQAAGRAKRGLLDEIARLRAQNALSHGEGIDSDAQVLFGRSPPPTAAEVAAAAVAASAAAAAEEATAVGGTTG